MKNLLVQMDASARSLTRLRLADGVAKRHGAHLTAIFATTPPLVDLPYAYAAETVAVQPLQDMYVKWRTKALAQFESAKLGPGADWAELGPEPVVEGFARQAMLADLVVVGQDDPDERDSGLPMGFASSVVLASGRPALVVPRIGRFETIAERVLFAWKPTAASARALAGALPLMKLAREVNVIQYGRLPQTCRGEALSLESYLRLHGVNATFQRHVDSPSNLGELLLSHAADVNADLLVMGCYGHSRAREMILGGVTRTVLQSMTLPVLMSH
ncbi:MAG TPA: universal stress protein [Burkholderiaceae bacterium]|jgi:nucleotide-binding universal stress UspA family protein|nr:universal stress protein [Burkholderiaceae bacterium]